MRRKLIAAVGAAALVAGATACGTEGGSAGDGGKKTLTVWVMDGSAPEPWSKELNKAFEAEHKGVEVEMKVQQWNGIQERITTALSEDSPPDVLELGNTQTAGYAVTGGLADLTPMKGELGYDQWNEGMLSSAELDGKLFAAPWYAANRAVIYDKSVYEEAGVKPPETREEWLAGLEKIGEKTDKQPLYLPGQSWYVFAGFLWDEGGNLAVEKGGDTWEGALASDEAAAAMDFYKELQSHSTAPKDADEATPQQSTDVVPKGDVASWIGLGWEAGGAVAAIEEAGDEADFGYFPIPGKTADQPGHVFFGGSNLSVSERSPNKELAQEWLQMATSEEWMTKYAEATEGGLLPNSPAAQVDPAEGSFAEAMVASAEVGRITPVTPGWANVETDPNPIKTYMTKVLEGTDPKQAGKEADEVITERINGS
ncbi:extracellular solute-binding protein [Streptomyces sp. DSM 42041]|uniref:Extracellular solute-binding protein n=1 Tax=Streptomyces hazeniae TaxID=3075538 RepID=A0ABU2NMU8_9ACTN|nr:extracellular solute-binding protein [Streptomyces sp. DSM 42041]MDT0378085.1 extracellular solute-binding protein [Streptomyces sp. DSM 42041]